jgi:hypothetical protein
MFWLFDMRTLIVLIPALLFAFYAQYKVQRAYAKYARVATRRRVTAAEAAQVLLARAGVSGVKIEAIGRTLGDHYDPRTKTLRLSRPTSPSIADVGVAAHEAGHAIQHAQGYAPLALRSAVVPLASFGSQLAFPLFFVGLLFAYMGSQLGITLLYAGIALFAGVVLFTLITLPVEFDASRRAVRALAQTGIVTREELGAVKEVLYAAALTYVAATAMAIAQLLRLLLIASAISGRRR